MNADEADVEVGAKTVDEAIEKALAQMGLERHQARIHILSTGKPGLLGIGGEEARVRVTPLLETPEGEPQLEYRGVEAGAEVVLRGTDASEVALASDHLCRLLELMEIDGEVSVRPPETPGDGAGRASAVLDVSGDDLGILIGRRGSTLAALQYLVNLMATRKLKEKVLVNVDVEGYKRRREESLCGLALRMAERVKQTGRPVTLEPMPAAERRIVHLALANDPQVATSSVGEEETRKVAISVRRRPPGRL
jgi:spoIIIJ-associated protein